MSMRPAQIQEIQASSRKYGAYVVSRQSGDFLSGCLAWDEPPVDSSLVARYLHSFSRWWIFSRIGCAANTILTDRLERNEENEPAQIVKRRGSFSSFRSQTNHTSTSRIVSIALQILGAYDVYMETEKSLSEMARRLAAQRKHVPVTCAVCGTQFEATTRRMYCSGACKQKSVRRRQGKTPRGEQS